MVGEDGFARLRPGHGRTNSPPDCLLGPAFRIHHPAACMHKKTNPSGLVFLWWGRTDSLRCGEATAVASVHWTLAKSRLSNPSRYSFPECKKSSSFELDFWWGRTDSNHRSETQQIYSLSPLATRELPHIYFRLGAGRRTRTPDLLITNQLLYQLSYTGVSNRTRLL